ncbi:MAG: segregation/condensation protein A [Planctomycetes bacterium]|nr:segregation/condensation protein A [Planctomycetota bacterium]
MTFRVDLAMFRGPLDLLLYLVRKQELEVTDIPVATITEQFLGYLEILKDLDVNLAADFIEMASTLIEIKSRMVLPRGGEETEELEDPREELVERLLMYKKYRDAASILDEQSRQWQQRLPRLADDLPPRRIEPAMQPIQEIELWDLVSAFGRIVRDSQVLQPANIVYDDTPIHVHMDRIHQNLLHDGRASFSAMFKPGMHKSSMIGVFLAILELVRHHSVRAEQEDLHGEIWILPGEAFGEQLDLSNVDNYGQPPASSAEEAEPAKPR